MLDSPLSTHTGEKPFCSDVFGRQEIRLIVGFFILDGNGRKTPSEYMRKVCYNC